MYDGKFSYKIEIEEFIRNVQTENFNQQVHRQVRVSHTKLAKWSYMTKI